MKKLVKNILLLAFAMGLIACGGGTTNEDNTNIIEETPQEDNNNSIPKITEEPKEDVNETIEDYLLAVNEARLVGRECGDYGFFPATTELTWNINLAKASLEHSSDLAISARGVMDKEEATKLVSHTGSATASDITAIALNLGQGSTSKQRVIYNDYDFSLIGENLTVGREIDTVAEAMIAWIESPEHCHILMDANFTEVGMAYVEDSDTLALNFWTQNFGKPMSQ